MVGSAAPTHPPTLSVHPPLGGVTQVLSEPTAPWPPKARPPNTIQPLGGGPPPGSPTIPVGGGGGTTVLPRRRRWAAPRSRRGSGCWTRRPPRRGPSATSAGRWRRGPRTSPSGGSTRCGRRTTAATRRMAPPSPLDRGGCASALIRESQKPLWVVGPAPFSQGHQLFGHKFSSAPKDFQLCGSVVGGGSDSPRTTSHVPYSPGVPIHFGRDDTTGKRVPDLGRATGTFCREAPRWLSRTSLAQRAVLPAQRLLSFRGVPVALSPPP